MGKEARRNEAEEGNDQPEMQNELYPPEAHEGHVKLRVNGAVRVVVNRGSVVLAASLAAGHAVSLPVVSGGNRIFTCMHRVVHVLRRPGSENQEAEREKK